MDHQHTMAQMGSHQQEAGQMQVKRDWKAAVKTWNKEKKQDFKTTKDFEVEVVDIDLGMKDKNPMDSVYFYHKRDPDKAFLITDQMFLPKDFYEKRFRVYYKGPEEKLKEAQKCFDEWRREYFKPKPEIIFFEDKLFQGKQYKCSSDCPDLQVSGLKCCSSFVVEHGTWVLHESYTNMKYVLTRGEYPAFQLWKGPMDLCSVKIHSDTSSTFKIQLYEQVDFIDTMYETTVECRSVEDQFGINAVRSCKVISGVWELYEGRDYNEPHYQLPEGDYSNPEEWGSQSSAPARSLKYE